MIEFFNFLFLITPLFFSDKTEASVKPNLYALASNNTSSVSKAYKLIWSDEFNIDGVPDSAKWRFETGFVRNEETQRYQKENAICINGNLVITAKKVRKSNPNFIAASMDWKKNRPFIEYTSSSVVMKKEHAFLYGKMEVRAKIITQTGLWPAIWTLGTSGDWPSNGEVDVMEYYDNKILANFAYASATKWKAIWDDASKPMSDFDSNWTDSYHVWSLEWTKDKMDILLDGVSMNSIDLTKTINQSDGKNPFHQAHYVLLNLALGGNRGGSLANTTLPSQYLIDYVRIYAPK